MNSFTTNVLHVFVSSSPAKQASHLPASHKGSRSRPVCRYCNLSGTAQRLLFSYKAYGFEPSKPPTNSRKNWGSEGLTLPISRHRPSPRSLSRRPSWSRRSHWDRTPSLDYVNSCLQKKTRKNQEAENPK